jgi:hypothetical protein
MLDEIKRSGGKFYTPRPDNTVEGDHYQTYLQSKGQGKLNADTKTDQFVRPFVEVRETKYENALFPNVEVCPHSGCWNWGFRSASDSLRHEEIFHPGQRLQRLADRAAARNNTAPGVRKHACGCCSLMFSKLNYLKKHIESYGHESQRTVNFRERASKRKSGVIPDKPPPRKLRRVRVDATARPLDIDASTARPLDIESTNASEDSGSSSEASDSSTDQNRASDSEESLNQNLDLDVAITFAIALNDRKTCACPSSLEPSTFRRGGVNHGKIILRKFLGLPGPGWAEGTIKKPATKSEQRSEECFNCQIAFTSDGGGVRPIRLQSLQYYDGRQKEAPLGSWVMLE